MEYLQGGCSLAILSLQFAEMMREKGLCSGQNILRRIRAALKSEKNRYLIVGRAELPGSSKLPIVPGISSKETG